MKWHLSKNSLKKEAKFQRKPWISYGIIQSMAIRDKFYKESTCEIDPLKKKDLFNSYKNYRNKIVTLLRKSKKQYFTDYFKEHNTNIKKTWEGIRSLINMSKKGSTTIQKIVDGDRVFTDSKGIANSLNSFYSNIGPSIENKIPTSKSSFKDYLTNPVTTALAFNPCLESEVNDIIKNFGSGKSSGPNSIPTNLLKEFSPFFTIPITLIVNKSLTEGTFPSLLKYANVCPIFKKNDKTKCANYRPISLLSNVSKIFERVVYNRVEHFLIEHDILYPHQYGFRKKYSTNHAILSILEEIRHNLDKGIFSCGVFVDLEKAFDTVNHKILIGKLDHYGIKGIANKWFSSYLNKRSQKVTLNGTLSETLPIRCGVPQGSILGPLLFLIYINDMNKALKECNVYHFADDTNLLFSHPDPLVLKKIMNKELKLLFEWLCANRLSLNVAKTEFIIFRPSRKSLQDRIVLELNRIKIFESTKIKYLGLILDNRLSFKFHISELSKKLSRSVGMLFKIRDFTQKSTLISLYHSIFNSHLTYGLPAWGHSTQTLLDRLNKLQKKAIRAISFASFSAPSKPLFKSLGLLKLDQLTYFKMASLLWDVDHGTIPPTLLTYFKKTNSVHQHATRQATSGKYCVPKTQSKLGANSFQSKGTSILNELKDMHIYKDALSKKQFLTKLKDSLIANY